MNHNLLKNHGFSLIKSLKVHIDHLTERVSVKKLFPNPPVLRFRDKRTVCSCGTKLKVMKTHTLGAKEIGKL